MNMKRGEIYFANLDPTIGTEIKKQRPALIISNDTNNKVASLLTIVPLTSNVAKVYPFEVFLSKKDTGLTKSSKAQCQQIRSISKLRIVGKCAGKISRYHLTQIENAIKLHLDFTH